MVVKVVDASAIAALLFTAHGLTETARVLGGEWAALLLRRV